MADPNAHTHHHLNQQPQLVSGPVPPLLLDPQTQVALAAAPPHIHSQHQFQPQHYSVLDNFWQQQFHEIRHGAHDFKVHQLPLARIKKVMKTDEEVKMISAEAPILFAKGCDIFITELTMRAWHHAEECKRRTLQRSDIANAIKKVDMFDFLIDIVPREDKVSVKTEKMEYQDHQNQYPYGMGMPPSGHPFNTSSNDHKIIMDPIAALHEQQQHLQHMQYMQRMESQHHHQILHDHSDHQQHQHHQHPPTLLPPLAPVAGQQVPSYRARPQYASVSTDVSAGPSVRQVTTEQPYQHPHYYNHSQELHHHQQQTPSQHQLHRQPDHNNPVQVKYEFESSVARPVEWYSQPSTQLANNGHNTRGYVQGNSHVNHSHGYGQPLSQSHDYNHDSTGVRHEEGYVRGGGVQRN